MSEIPEALLQAIELALAGQWDEAHNVVQQYEGNATAAWIHAVLHKIEGDPANARYWYRLAGKLEHVNDEPHAELAAIRAGLVARATGG
jgi:phosphodiesterase/alkaline phosphatase D-like protein